MNKPKIEFENSIEKDQKNKLKQVRLGLAKTIYDYEGIKLNSFGFHHLNFFHDALVNNSVEEEFKVEWEYKPQHIAEEYLNDFRMHHIIMFVNNVCCMDDFNIGFIGTKVKIPRMDIVTYIEREIRRFNVNEAENEELIYGIG